MQRRSELLPWLGLLLACILMPISTISASDSNSTLRPSLLVYSHTTGWRHASIDAGRAALRTLATQQGWTLRFSENPADFTSETLKAIDVVVFLNTTGDVLDGAGERALQDWYRAGGGFVGVHSATDTEPDWPWYGALAGARFDRHPAVQPARLRIVDASHPSTRALPSPWMRRDEWYDLRDIQPGLQILIDIDADQVRGATRRGHQPVAWCREFDGGRSWVTLLGHTPESFDEPLFRAHLTGGIEWVLGAQHP